MNTNHGFSLTEVMVSLLLMTSTSLVLLKQQWQISQLANQAQLRTQASNQLDNICERLLAGQAAITDDKRLHVNTHKIANKIMVSVAWKKLSMQPQACCLLRREITLL